jgi:hypothetical protein
VSRGLCVWVDDGEAAKMSLVKRKDFSEEWHKYCVCVCECECVVR